jgi:alpha-glucoside transport system substrate-binding protein
MKFSKSVAALAALAVITAPVAASAAKKTTKKKVTKTTKAAPTTVPAAVKTIANGTIECKNQYKGKTVNIFSPVRDSATDAGATQRKNAYIPFEECTGAKINFEGTDQFETQIKVRLEGGNAPDAIEFPQPGLLASIAAKGQLKPLTGNALKSAQNDFISGWLEYGTVAGKVYGIPQSVNIKSLIWYSPAAFAAKGYKIPGSLEDLKALSDKIVADGGTPWCVGAESGVATGWVLTDWMEDFMLRTNGEKVYDAWVNHSMAFNDPKVKAVMDAVGAYVKNPKYIGSESAVKNIATTKFQEGGFPILDGKCYMHRQASFYKDIWPDGTTIGESGKVNTFYLPSPANGPKYMLGAGDIWAAGTDKPETMDVLLYGSSLQYMNDLEKVRTELSPRKDFDPAKITNPVGQNFARLLKGADVFRFDASDLMPGAVGSGTFWTEITKWITGQSTDDTVNNIEKSWPKA